jgi:hypothetical protein
MSGIDQKQPLNLKTRVRKWLSRIPRLAVWVGSVWASLHHLKTACHHAMAAQVTPTDWALVERLGLCGPNTGNSVGAVLYHAMCAGLVGLQSMMTYFYNDAAALALLLIAGYETWVHGRRAQRFVCAMIGKAKAVKTKTKL